MLELLHSHRDQKILRLQEILHEADSQAVLAFQKQWWQQFCSAIEADAGTITSGNLIKKALILERNVSRALTSIQQQLTMNQQLYFACQSDHQGESESSDDQNREYCRKEPQPISDTPEDNFTPDPASLSLQLTKARESLEQCQKQNAELMKRLIKTLERCYVLVQKVDRLKKENSHLQVQDSNSIKYYERLLAENKRQLKEKDQMITMYESKLEICRGHKSPATKLATQNTERGYPYTSEGILDRIQSLRALAKGKIKSKSNATQIPEIS